ncbi:hypothetical protein Tco_0737063, partial [Tanacetum coccineum]
NATCEKVNAKARYQAELAYRKQHPVNLGIRIVP